jgi:hypothetical protein
MGLNLRGEKKIVREDCAANLQLNTRDAHPSFKRQATNAPKRMNLTRGPACPARKLGITSILQELAGIVVLLAADTGFSWFQLACNCRDPFNGFAFHSVDRVKSSHDKPWEQGDDLMTDLFTGPGYCMQSLRKSIYIPSPLFPPLDTRWLTAVCGNV